MTGATRTDESSDHSHFSHKPRESRANNEIHFTGVENPVWEGKSRVPGKEIVLAALGRSGEKSDSPNSLLEDKRISKRNMQDSLGS